MHEGAKGKKLVDTILLNFKESVAEKVDLSPNPNIDHLCAKQKSSFVIFKI